MNPNEQEIERLLRRAPKPLPPAGLKSQLTARVPSPGADTPLNSRPISIASEGWLRRWWPLFIPAAASLICAVVLALQQAEINDLRESIHTLSKDLPAAQAIAGATPTTDEIRTDASANLAGNEPAEIERLKQLATQLTAEVADLEQVQKGNEELRAKLNAPPTLTQEELDALAKAKEKALAIACINNLKQFGLAVRIWAVDHNDALPPDSLSMSNELNTPKILVCPADTNRVVAKSWAVFSTANCTYEYFTPSATNAESEPQRVLSRCPIHGHVGLCDGSVQSEIGKKHPDWFKERDGKLYLEY